MELQDPEKTSHLKKIISDNPKVKKKTPVRRDYVIADIMKTKAKKIKEKLTELSSEALKTLKYEHAIEWINTSTNYINDMIDENTHKELLILKGNFTVVFYYCDYKLLLCQKMCPRRKQPDNSP